MNHCFLILFLDQNKLLGDPALRQAGCDVIVATTACGSLDESYKPGDLVILDDFIDRTHKRPQSFYDGSQPNDFHKICHIPMFPAFSNDLRALLINQAEHLGLSFHKTGTIVTVEGPRFSSRAESRLFQSWGAHCINM
jgi:5'-methylthioadenosine phosphorylase